VKVLAVDGGGDQQKTTREIRGSGWSLIQFGDHPPLVLDGGLVPGGPDPFLAEITRDGSRLGEALRNEADQLVVENFVPLIPRVNAGPLEIVGMMKTLGWAYDLPVAVQMPGQRTIVSHDDLKKHGYWPGGKGHADQAQAVRHALAWAILQGNRPTVELFAPDPGE